MRSIKGRVVGILGVVLLAGFLASCGGSSGQGSGGSLDQAAASKLPAAVKQSGQLRVATSYQWPPFDYQNSSGKAAGIDIEIVEAIAAKLGLQARFTNLQFPSIVPGVSNGRFDIGVNELSDTPERRQTVQFVDYYRSGLAVLARKGTSDITATDLCGHSIALTQGSSQVAIAQQVSTTCVNDGKKPLALQYYPDSGVTILAVSNGRADAFMTDEAVGVYTTKTSAKNLSVLPGTVPNTTSLSGIVIAKDDTKLAQAVRAALQDLIENGRYHRILAKYGVANAAIPRATINGKA